LRETPRLAGEDPILDESDCQLSPELRLGVGRSQQLLDLRTRELAVDQALDLQIMFEVLGHEWSVRQVKQEG
jgi:hypothetical protein